MAVPQFDIIFRGVRAGFPPESVKAQFAILFKVDATKVERIFKSKNVVLKHHADERIATIFITRLFAIGVLAEKRLVEVVVPNPIHVKDNGEVSTDACAMHQPVEFLYGEHTRRIPFVFNGNGFDYFKIWVVNVLVVILSAGILLPWAKVRSMRYFYQHTFLDNAEFQCKANPQKIYLIQFLFIVYLIALIIGFFYSSFYFATGLIILIGILPLYWFKRKIFEHKYSLYREVGFHHDANLQDAYKIFLGWPLLVIMSVGFLAPYALLKMQQYRIQKTFIGDYEFSFSSVPKKYLGLLLPLLTAETITFACLHWYSHFPFYSSFIITAAAWLAVFIRWRVILVNLQWNGVSSKLGYFVSNWELRSYGKLVLQNLLLCILTIGFYWPWAKVRLAKYKSEHLAFFANQRFKKWQRNLNSSNL